MILRNMIFYTVAGSVLWAVAGRMGAGLIVNMILSLMVPPVLLFGYALYKGRGPLL
jgi:hypothetical protein